jgi:hypothetical protein
MTINNLNIGVYPTPETSCVTITSQIIENSQHNVGIMVNPCLKLSENRFCTDTTTANDDGGADDNIKINIKKIIFQKYS